MDIVLTKTLQFLDPGVDLSFSRCRGWQSFPKLADESFDRFRPPVQLRNTSPQSRSDLHELLGPEATFPFFDGYHRGPGHSQALGQLLLRPPSRLAGFPETSPQNLEPPGIVRILSHGSLPAVGDTNGETKTRSGPSLSLPESMRIKPGQCQIPNLAGAHRCQQCQPPRRNRNSGRPRASRK